MEEEEEKRKTNRARLISNVTLILNLYTLSNRAEFEREREKYFK